jgi:L-alanine-DL-glutamate epimerase-like enolase superfamily enzyme
MPDLAIRVESWPIRGSFAISRGAKTAADVVLVELRDGDWRGRGECVPYARYGESIDSVVAQIESLRQALRQGMDRQALQGRLPPGAARNAVDCACWDMEAKRSGRRVWDLLDLPPPRPVTTAYTLSLDSADAMHRAAADTGMRR